jgi:hypothetical protein
MGLDFPPVNPTDQLIRKIYHPKYGRAEIYGWLLAHYCVRAMMFRAAETSGISPLKLGFTGTLKVIRRAIPIFQQAAPEEMNLFMSWLIAEILDNQLPLREGRINPRVVKKPRSKFKTAKPEHRGQGTKLQRLDFRVSQVA